MKHLLLSLSSLISFVLFAQNDSVRKIEPGQQTSFDKYGLLIIAVVGLLLLMGLRLAEGIALARYTDVAGRPLDRERIADLMRHGLVETTPDGRLRVTSAGFPVLDAVVADLAA